MNRFTNKNGGILPFQMIKLAAGSFLKDVAGAASDFVSHTLPGYFRMGADDVGQAISNGNHISIHNNVQLPSFAANKGGKATSTSGSVPWEKLRDYIYKKTNELGQKIDGVGSKFDDLSGQFGGLSTKFDDFSGQVTDSLANVEKLVAQGVRGDLLTDAVKLLKYHVEGQNKQLMQLIQQALDKGDKELATFLQLQMARNTQLLSDKMDILAKKMPGFGKIYAASLAGTGTAGGVYAGVSHYANKDANKAHAAGNDAAKEGELAELQSGQGGSWWDRTWNDIDKFREEHPGWFYGLSGLGLLGGGYALSEMLDDDDEEDEYRRY